jgi:hypothetical protein
MPVDPELRSLAIDIPAQPHREGDRRDLARAQVRDRLLHRLDPAAQAVQRRVHRLQHRRCERHVSRDQCAHGLQVDALVAQQHRQVHQRLGLRRDVDGERTQFGIDGHGGPSRRDGREPEW